MAWQGSSSEAPVRPKIARQEYDSDEQGKIEAVGENGEENENIEDEAGQVQEDDDQGEQDEEREEEREGLGQDDLRRVPREKKKKKVKMNTKVYRPSQLEVAEHEATHCPFRPWCRHCVRGRASNTQHRCNQEDKEEKDEAIYMS